MDADTIERLNFFQFQQMGPEDFQVEQAYHRDQLRRHSVGEHSWGIVGGCRIVEIERQGDPDFRDIQVTPGLAIDGFGREILILQPARLPPELFASFDGDRVIELALQYDEYASRTGNDKLAVCALDGAYSRVIETYRFVVGAEAIADPDPVMVGGEAAKPALPNGDPDGGAPIRPDDGSIAWQEFPLNDRGAHWPVRLGSVHWDGTANKFRPAASPSVLIQERRYAGLIGASLLAEGQALRIAPRIPVAMDKRDDADFASIEGRLTVDGRIVANRDVLVEGGKVSFQGAGGDEAGNPLWISRLSTGGSGSDLWIHIGDTPGSANARLTIGVGPSPYSFATEKIVMAVRADDKVDIPNGRLRFGGTSRQAIDLNIPDDTKPGTSAIGWQGGSIYQRSTTGFYWYNGGDHSGTEGDPGTGGTRLMRLGNDGSLYFGNAFRQLLNFDMATGGGTQSSGIGAQDQTLYFRSPQDFGWFRGGGHDNGTLSPGGGALAMSLNAASVLTVEGGLRSKGDIALWGTSLSFLDGSGGTDTDPLEITRHQRMPDYNDLQVTIGDNTGGDDRFVVGPRIAGSVKEQFIVRNDGNVYAAGDVYSHGKNVMFDVVAGEYPLNALGAGTGTVNLPVTSSRLSSISGAEIMVALSDIKNVNVATDARWRVSYTHGTSTLNPPNGATFPIHWAVEDIDGQLLSFSYIAILYA